MTWVKMTNKEICKDLCMKNEHGYIYYDGGKGERVVLDDGIYKGKYKLIKGELYKWKNSKTKTNNV